MVGVQSLSIGLSIALVVVTGCLVGSLSMTTGNQLLDDARATGARSLSSSLSSSDADIKMVAGRYLTSVTNGLSAKITGIFDRADALLEGASNLIQSQEPDRALGVFPDNDFLDNVLRGYMRASVETFSPYGFSGFGLKWSNRTGMQWHFLVHESQAIPAPGTRPWGVMETQCLACPDKTFNTEFPPQSMPEYNFYVGGVAGPDGKMIDTEEECFIYRDYPNNLANVPNLAHDKFGRCLFPHSVLFAPWPGSDEEQYLWSNMMIEERAKVPGMVAPTDQIVFGELTAYYSGLQIDAMRVVTHPNYVNPYAVLPEHRNRMGFLSLVINSAIISDMLEDAKADMPDNTILYLTAENPFTGHRERLVSTNHGRISGWRIEQRGVFAYDWRVDIEVRNHSMNGSTWQERAKPSLVSHHATMVYDTYGNDSFIGAVANTSGSFAVWNDPEGNEWWYQTRQIEYGPTLRWFLNMLVPRASVMAAIDASVLSVRTQEAQDRKAADEKQERAMIVIVVVTVCVAVVLMAASAVVTNMILKPLNELGDDMASVAVMHVEDVNMLKKMSALSEVQRMQTSFRTMVTNLLEYKQYMPASVLLDDEDDSGSENSQRSVSQPASVSMGKSRQSIGSKSSLAEARRNQAGVAVNKLNDMSLKRKTISVVSYNLRSWLTVSAALGDTALPEVYSGVLSALLGALKMFKGVADTFAGDHVLAAHNAFSNQATHKKAALEAALAAVQNVSEAAVPGSAYQKLSLSFACTSGEAKIGQMGCQGMKKVTINSAIVPWSAKLEDYNNKRGYLGTMDGHVAKDVRGNFLFRQTDVVQFTKRAAEKMLEVYEVLETVAAAEDEWMYQLEDALSSNPFTSWEQMWALASEGNTGAARDELSKIEHQCITPSERQRMSVLLGSFAPLNLDTTYDTLNNFTNV
eukprot:TRINITY_DN1251_c0_g1_i1.p1 TRINITY_DN1251_c0_g1~~TRINITY_DN1251_c0_g1_i1.p1  ORF type:complete len:918 (+),score=272.81 TRINITY_DN1251_c0_g1_i1:74-2827(+)